MSGFNGSGTFNISGVGLPYVSGTTISSSVANQLNTDIATGLSTCITKDGQSTVTANIGWNNFNINNLSALGIGTAAPLGQMEVKSGPTTNFIIDSSGNVGIGTSNPTTNLHVYGSSPIITSESSTNIGGQFRAKNTNGSYAFGVTGSTGGAWLLYDNINSATMYTSAYTYHIFNTSNTERMRIDSSGNVGIGTNSPAQKLDVVGTTSTTLARNSTTTGANGFNAANTSGNFYFGIDSSAGTFYGATAYGRAIYSDGAYPISIYTAATERMRIDSNGYALIGYTSSNGAYKLQVNSQIFATSSTIATSDGRYKENVNTLENALDLVCALNPVSFDWKQHPVHNFDRSTTTTGFIAQEVQTALQNTAYVNAIVKTNTCVIEPEEKDADGNVTKPAVTEEFLGIAEGNLIAILTKAVQELKTELDTVKTELAALKGS